MRKLLALLLFVGVALFFGAHEQAFAHAEHSHRPQVQADISQTRTLDGQPSERGHQVFQSVSPFSMGAATCPHHNSEQDCGFCCACAGGICAALATPDYASIIFSRRVRESLPVLLYLIRQASLDLSRPPKFFV